MHPWPSTAPTSWEYFRYRRRRDSFPQISVPIYPAPYSTLFLAMYHVLISHPLLIRSTSEGEKYKRGSVMNERLYIDFKQDFFFLKKKKKSVKEPRRLVAIKAVLQSTSLRFRAQLWRKTCVSAALSRSKNFQKYGSHTRVHSSCNDSAPSSDPQIRAQFSIG